MDAVTAGSIAAVTVVIGAGFISRRPRLVDITTYLLPLPSLLFGVVAMAMGVGGSVGLLFVALSGVVLLVIVGLAREFAARRFLVTMIAPSEIPAVAALLEDALGRHGVVRTRNAPPVFEAGVDFLIGPGDPILGLAPLGFGRPLTRPELRRARRVVSARVPGRIRLGTWSMGAGLVGFGVASAWVYLQIP